MPKPSSAQVPVALVLLLVASCVGAPSQPAQAPLESPGQQRPLAPTTTATPDCPGNVPSDPPWVCRKGQPPIAPTRRPTSRPLTAAQQSATSPPSVVPVTKADFAPMDLPQQGPLLAYFEGPRSSTGLFLVHPETYGRFEFQLEPDAILSSSPMSGLSPRGRYLAFFRGGHLDPKYNLLDSISDAFSLDVIDLHTGEPTYSAELLGDDYMSDLEALAARLSTDPYFQDADSPLAEARSASESTLLYGIRSLAWSQDGGVLAFASQEHGPSSDLYFFAPTLRDSWRVSSELGHIEELSWAPGSSSIVAITADYDTHGGLAHQAAVFSREGKRVLSVSPYLLGWANPQWLLYSNGRDYGDGFFDLRAVPISGEPSLSLWAETFGAFALAPDLSEILISRTDTPPDEVVPRGLLRTVPGSSTPNLLSDGLYWAVSYWGSDQFEFAAASPDKGTVGVGPTGALTQLDSLPWKVEASPDGSLAALYASGQAGPHNEYPGPTGLRIIDDDGNLIAVLATTPVYCPAWRPDSRGLAFQSYDGLYYWELGSSTTTQIDFIDDWSCDFAWTFP